MQRRLLAGIGALALTLTSATTAAHAASTDDSPSPNIHRSDSTGKVSSDFRPASVGADGKVSVIIEMSGDPVAKVEAEKGSPLSDSERSAVRGRLRTAQDAIRGSITGKGGRIEAEMQSAYNGIQASVPADKIDQVAALPNVVAVHPVRTYTLDNAVSVPFLGVPAVWQDTGYTGKNVKVGIIDTGIDYTHADFQGPGTPEAYTAAHANEAQPADPALFGPSAPRVKGGTDLVGDSYNADPASATYQPVPHPDDNPLDCQGHGSHVAGTAAGGGVNADGTAYTGPYDASTPSKAFTVGPGVAPQADLYAIRVFGCDGSTDVVVPAIDWAVAHGMDVINMSLGSPFGTGDTPDAVAAANAVGAGVVVVASAGNQGPNPYLTGSPASGDGVISVSAVDSTEGFPGAAVTVNGASVQAIRANGVTTAGLGTLSVVRLTGDDRLGCAAAAFTNAGIAQGGNQLAVVDRGTCARAAKAIYGQQAGAAAVLMVNSSAGLPPYEGPITSNPDTGEAYTVTIPFLGVSKSDGPAFTTGASATFADQSIANPGFRAYASFSSAGPRSGDSAISPDVAAPGVSIASAGVGTGNGFETLSGTSMAAPHVTGVAALSVQSHPTWSAAQVAASIDSTADPDKVAGQALTRGGVGLVDAAQAVSTQVTATGDAFRTESGWARESALSFGFQESTTALGGVKTITVRNDGNRPVTYQVSSAADAASLPAKVSARPATVTVKPGSTAKVLVTLAAAASSVPSSVSSDMFAFHQFSGDIVLTAPGSTLRVPYLLVPRSNSKVVAGSAGPWFGKSTKVKAGTQDVTLRNGQGALDAAADFYTWGLSDPKDAPKSLDATGYDVRGVGVQSFSNGVAAFAINTYDRYSNAAANEYDVLVDTNGDGAPDWAVVSADQGAVLAGDNNGVSEVFLFDLKTGAGYESGFYATAPTDSSTVLLPFSIADLGITGPFRYAVNTFSSGGGQDSVAGWATYDPAQPALSNGQYVTVPTKGSVTVPVTVDPAAFAAQKPLGTMVVVYDNRSGADEAILVSATKK